MLPAEIVVTFVISTLSLIVAVLTWLESRRKRIVNTERLNDIERGPRLGSWRDQTHSFSCTADSRSGSWYAYHGLQANFGYPAKNISFTMLSLEGLQYLDPLPNVLEG